MSDDDSLRVAVDYETYIPTALHRIAAALGQQLEDESEREDFGHLRRMLHSIYHFEYHRISQQLKRDYTAFSSDAHARDYAGSADPGTDVDELRFLKNFFRVMEAANFRPVTQQDIEFTEAHDYMFTLPIQIDWESMDGELLTKFITEELTPEQAERMPEFCKKILIFRRGVGIDRVKGFLILQKIDALVDELIFRLAYFGKMLFRKGGDPEDVAAEVREALETPISLSNPDDGVDLDESSAGDGADAPLDPLAGRSAKSHIHPDRFVERVTLRSTMTGPSWALTRTELQEPTFKEVIILFCSKEPVADDSGIERSLVIKAFRDIPMADLEVVFPDKRISMKPLDLIKLISTGVVGLVLVVGKLLAATALNPVLALAALSTIGGYAAKVLLGMRDSYQRYQHVVTDSLYRKNVDNDLGVIFYLVDSLEEQEVKEALLGYYFLWTEGAMSAADLDARCETWLRNEFQVEVDFEVEDSLRKLLAEGIVTFDGECYHAIPIAAALETLDHKWDNYFQFNLA